MPLYQLFMLALCILALAGIVVQHASHDPEIEAVLDVTDFVICIAFGIDFLVSLWTAPDRLRSMAMSSVDCRRLPVVDGDPHGSSAAAA